jgi:hypothetical protein
VRRLDAAFFPLPFPDVLPTRGNKEKKLTVTDCGAALIGGSRTPFGLLGVRRLDAAFFLCLFRAPRQPAGTKEKKESGVKPPHSKVRRPTIRDDQKKRKKAASSRRTPKRRQQSSTAPGANRIGTGLCLKKIQRDGGALHFSNSLQLLQHSSTGGHAGRSCRNHFMIQHLRLSQIFFDRTARGVQFVAAVTTRNTPEPRR